MLSGSALWQSGGDRRKRVIALRNLKRPLLKVKLWQLLANRIYFPLAASSNGISQSRTTSINATACTFLLT